MVCFQQLSNVKTSVFVIWYVIRDQKKFKELITYKQVVMLAFLGKTQLSIHNEALYLQNVFFCLFSLDKRTKSNKLITFISLCENSGFGNLANECFSVRG